ncbi:MAG: sigma 54-interacting transcriptional regulator [Desulfobacter sp.]|nr:MAG: sigma 54-interacting transcriptional regulator [Desulfobacter sp.]
MVAHKELLEDMGLDLPAMISIWEDYQEGIVISNYEGRVAFYNKKAAQMDDLKAESIIGKKVTDMYLIDDGISPTIKCINTRKRVANLACFYRTNLGKMVNSICNVFPVFHQGNFKGAFCSMQEYATLKRTIEKASHPRMVKDMQKAFYINTRHKEKMQPNGTRFTFDHIIGDDPSLLRAKAYARKASDSPSSIILSGETGTGKELFAQSIHNSSPRQNAPYVAINCAAIPEHLLEGILFGTSKGAFTGATDKAGLFETANGGTLLLDEINSMPLGLQVKLLRVLQERQVRRVGASKETSIDLKIVSTTNEDLKAACSQGNFRMDMMYRLGAVYIEIPPLRDRPGDIEILVRHFLDKYNLAFKRKIIGVSDEALDLFLSYHWPGNVRELAHIIEGAMNMVGDMDVIGKEHLALFVGHFPQLAEQEPEPGPLIGRPSRESGEREGTTDHHPALVPPILAGQSLSDALTAYEIAALTHVLDQTKGNASEAARRLSISPQLMHHKLKKFHIDPKDFKI